MLAFALPRRPTLILLACGRTQWGALGRAKSGEVILVEAKAHVSEILSPGSQALEDSLPLIRASVGEAATGLGALPGAVDWSQRFYQYTNRLAHAYLLRELNGVPTLLVFLYFIGDREMGRAGEPPGVGCSAGSASRRPRSAGSPAVARERCFR